MTELLKKACDALKAEIENSDIIKAYKEARDKYNADTRLTSLITEYNVQAALLEQESRKDESERDADLIASINGRINAIYEEVSSSPALAELQQAEQAVSGLIGEINMILQSAIYPEETGCTHDCSTCGGCH